ncbi:MAG TPA: protease pro-enzyme activation domain-containing protein [Thermoplasmata archaeon]|nr:protease pro-enzyme activation domain-containing protein [Thermoplasmata archaeon]
MFRRVAVVLIATLLFGGVVALHPATSAAASDVEKGRLVVAADGAPLAVALNPLGAATPLALTVSLEPRGATDLAKLDSALAGPHPPSYVTERLFEQRFSPSAANRTALERYFSGFGGTGFSTTPDGLTLRLSIPAGGAEQAFATELGSRPGGAPSSWSWSRVPTLPTSIAPMVAGVGGLARTAYVPATPLREVHQGPRTALPTYAIDGNVSGADLYAGADYVQAYGENRLFPNGSASGVNHTFATGQAVATILMSGFNSTTQTDLPPWDPSQIFDYFNDTFPSNWPVPKYSGVPVTVSGVTPPLPGPYNGANDTSFDEAENSLDIEMAGSAAPGAAVVNFYFAASLFENVPTGAPFGPVADDFATALGDALSYNYSGARLDAVTNSFALPDLNDSAWNLELAHAAATGVTVVAASGDQGNAPAALSGRFQGQWPGWPTTAAFDSFGTVSVGGASISLVGNASGTYRGNSSLPDQFDPNVTGIAAQSAWYDSAGANFSGTEGGLSLVIPEPAWQFDSAAQPAIASAGGAQGASFLGRATPDVAFPANETIAYVAHDASGTYFAILEGTSIASPFFAGLLTEWSAVAGHPFGFVDPALYRIAGYYAAHPGAGDPFLDVTSGANYVFAAGPGWDAATGWGGIDGAAFLGAYANGTVRDFNYTGPTPGLPTIGLPLTPATPGLTLLLIVAGVVLAVALVALVVWDERVRRTKLPPTGPYQSPSWSYAPGPPPPPAWGSGPPPPAHPYGIAAPPPYGGHAPGAPPPWGPPPPPAWFVCPYCGAPRPAEPVRCPGCGAF